MTLHLAVPVPQKGWLLPLLITLLTVAIFIISIISLISGWQTIFQNLFYFPIILACVYYVKRGFVFSVLLACSYFVLMTTFSNDPVVLQGAFIRVLIFILVGGVITYLTRTRIQAEEELLKKNEELTASYEQISASEEVLRHNMDELTRQELALQEGEALYRSILNASPEGITITYLEGRIRMASPAAMTLLGYASEEELLGHLLTDFLVSEDRDRAQANVALMHQGVFSGPGEYSAIRADGSLLDIEVNGEFIRDASGQPTGMVFIVHDITERKRAEIARLKNTEELHAANEQLTAAEEVLKSQFDALAESERMIRESEGRVRKKLESLLSPEGNIGTLDLADIIDVQEIQSIMDDFLSLTHIGVAIIDIHGNVLVATGWQDICTKFHRVNPETCANCIESDTFLSDGIEPGTVKLYRCKNNMWDIVTPITVREKHLGNIFFGQFFFEDDLVDYDLFRSQARKHGFDEVEYLTALERVPRYSREQVDTVMAFYAKFARMLSTLSHRNITLARAVTERDTTLTSLMRVNQKLSILSELTTKDLTNQIFVLNSYLELAKEHAKGQDPIIHSIQKGEQVVRSINKITETTKEFQDMGVNPPKWQNVNMALLFGVSHISLGNIQHSLETETLEIFADPLLEKVCQGLFENSLAHGGYVSRIRVWHMVIPDGVTIFFEDDGCGIPLDKKEQIFLHGEGFRVSMRGLFFIREIFDITGITIRETGETGKGARFEITVPKGMWRFTGDGA